MSFTSNCKTDTTVEFTDHIGNNQLLFWVDRLTLSEQFRLTAKLELLKKIMSTRSKE